MICQMCFNEKMIKNNREIIKVKNVSKTYKLYKSERQRLLSVFKRNGGYIKKNAINDISFSVEKGESVAIFGRNGAGKSTLLKLITGVTYPTSGVIRVNGRVSAMLELTAGFNAEMTGRNNIYFRGELLGATREEIRNAEKDIIEFASLGDYIDQPVRTYSSGMKARLGFAVNVNIKPEILIVDEALSVGDEKFRRKCNDKINELVSDGATFLFVTHSTASARKFCKRGIVLKNGKIVCDDEIDKAVDYYATMINNEK